MLLHGRHPLVENVLTSSPAKLWRGVASESEAPHLTHQPLIHRRLEQELHLEQWINPRSAAVAGQQYLQFVIQDWVSSGRVKSPT